jgi:hypothetical protein
MAVTSPLRPWVFEMYPTLKQSSMLTQGNRLIKNASTNVLAFHNFRFKNIKPVAQQQVLLRQQQVQQQQLQPSCE